MMRPNRCTYYGYGIAPGVWVGVVHRCGHRRRCLPPDFARAGSESTYYRRVLALGWRLLKTQLRHAWLDSRRALEEMTQDEYFWEPASPCWSVRRRSLSVRGWPAILGWTRKSYSSISSSRSNSVASLPLPSNTRPTVAPLSSRTPVRKSPEIFETVFEKRSLVRSYCRLRPSGQLGARSL